MRVIKKINNNAAVCIDNGGTELVAIGIGIGYPEVPYELEDLNKIQKTYYDVNPLYQELLNDIPSNVFEVTEKIVELYQNRLSLTTSPNLVFTLADHIAFAIERTSKGIFLENPLQFDIQHLYPKEYELGLLSLKLIQKDLGVRLTKVEATNIALHLINAENGGNNSASTSAIKDIIEEVTDIISNHFNIYIDRKSISYSRFASHFQYLLKRDDLNKKITSDNIKMFYDLKERYPESYQAVVKIKEFLFIELDFHLTDEEALYLIIHINRLCVREGL